MNKSRREFLQQALAAGSVLLVPDYAIAKAAALPSLSGRRILFTYGGWDGHEPEKFRDYMTAWMKEEGAVVDLRTDLQVYTDKTYMDTVDMVIQIFTMSQITPEQEKGLLNAIAQNGTAMAGWHGGMCDAFRNNTEYQFMTGGQWVAHPGGEIDYTVNIVDHKDPVTAGLRDFAMHSEQYYMHVDPNVKVLATTRFNGKINPWIDGCVMPVAWKKTYGKGRIFYTSVGHNLAHVTSVPDAIELMKRGIRWASASKYEPAEKWLAPVYGR